MAAVSLAFSILSCAPSGDAALGESDGGPDSADSRTDSADSETVESGDSSDSTDSGDCTKTTWYRDADGDGYGDPVIEEIACEAPEGFVSNSTDCDDEHSEAYSGATERWTDGIDDDCDGVMSSESLSELPLWQAVGSYAANLGYSVATADLSGDGTPDLVLGGSIGYLDGDLRRATVRVFDGPLPDTTTPLDDTSASADLYGGSLDFYPLVCAVGDLDSDGSDDLVIGVPKANGPGAAYVVRGPIDGIIDLTIDTQVFTGSGDNETFGNCAGPGDVDGDGASDLVLGRSEVDGTALAGQGAAYVFAGPADESDLEAANQTLAGTDDDEHIGYGVAAVGDFDGDGLHDFSVTNAPSTASSIDGFATYLVTDHSEGTLHPRDAGTTVHYDVAGSIYAMFASEIGDVDSDGYEDVALGVDSANGGGTLWVVKGSMVPELGMDVSADADITFTSSVGGARSLEHATALGDWNGDGGGVLAIADGRFSTEAALAMFDCERSSSCEQGAVYLIALPIDDGAHDLATEADRLEGVFPDGVLGGRNLASALHGGSDLSGNGFPDLAFAAPYADAGDTDAGAAYVLFGGGSP